MDICIMCITNHARNMPKNSDTIVKVLNYIFYKFCLYKFLFHGMASPQVADRRAASDKEVSYE